MPQHTGIVAGSAEGAARGSRTGTREEHRCEVYGSPFPGVFGTTSESARHFGRHWHATYGVGLLEGGAQRSASGRGQVDALPGDVITTNPGEVHDGQPLFGPTRRWRMVYLEPEALAAVVDVPGGPAPRQVEVARPVLRDALLARALRGLLGRLEGLRASPGGAADVLACEEALVRTCALLLGRHGSGGGKALQREAAADVARTRERLAEAAGGEAPSLAALAAQEGVSRFQLLRRFERAYGLPPHAWLLQRRAERARGLIRAGASLARAAAEAGFADQSHLTRVFGRHFGFTPGAWQRAVARR
jgi:AraC-like DNA-binding protein